MNKTKVHKKLLGCDNCNFYTHDSNKLQRHCQRIKHNKNVEESTKVCRVCGEKFTEDGYIRHLERNKSLIELWHKRNHHTGVGYNADGWQIGFKKYGGYNGELLPKCNINRAFNQKFETFEECIEYTLKVFDEIYQSKKRPQRGKLPDPFQYLKRDQCAPYEEMTEEEESLWIENDRIAQQEYQKNKKKAIVEKQEKLFNFKFSEIDLEQGYYLSLGKDSTGKYPQETYNFCDFIGLYRPNSNLNELKEHQEHVGLPITFLPNEDNMFYGTFFTENEDGSSDEVAIWKEPQGNEDRELIWSYEYNSDLESDEEITVI